jgi:hypothetical protein
VFGESGVTAPFQLEKLLRDVFDPDASDTALVMVDEPTARIPDNPDWAERRIMADSWRDGFAKLGVTALPFTSYAATGANNGNLPIEGRQGDHVVCLEEEIARATIVVAMTRYSATAPLSMLTKKYPALRVASMPNVLKRMEQSALAADYVEVARKANILARHLNAADTAEVVFATGHTFQFDLRFREAHADDGMCRRDKQGFRLINLPSGEAFIVPYEGERPDEPSRTEGEIPLDWKGHHYIFTVRNNIITSISGDGPERGYLEDHFALDPARRNIAELGLGCNDRAIITGNVLEDEKAGFHWAYGRSEHLGGTVGPDAFADPANVVHHDVVYAKGCPIEIASLDLVESSGVRHEIIRDGMILFD